MFLSNDSVMSFVISDSERPEDHNVQIGILGRRRTMLEQVQSHFACEFDKIFGYFIVCKISNKEKGLSCVSQRSAYLKGPS